MLRVNLTPEGRAAVEPRRRAPTLSPAERDRVEMVLLSAAGWKVPEIAAHFACCHATVRRVLHRFAAQGPAAFRRQHSGPQANFAYHARITAALERRLAEDRTWTAAQLADALHDDDPHLSARQLRRYLPKVARWRRVARTLRHRQDPVRVARAKDELAELKKGRRRAS